MQSGNILVRHIFNLTGNKINFNNIKKHIHIAEKYHPLFYNISKKSDVTLSEISDVYNCIILRKEEARKKYLDKHVRFDHDVSILVQNGLDQSPIIDELVLEVIRQLNLKVKNIWPECKKAAVCLTHDVDSIDGYSYFYLRKFNWYWNWFRASLRGNHDEADKWIENLKKWVDYKKINYDPMDSFDQIKELEDSHGFRSTFFFMALRHGLSREGRRYAINNPRLTQVARGLLKDGWEVGLHGAYYGHLSLSSLKEQKQRLEEIIRAKVYGCRHHYVRVNFPQSWVLYAQAGFLYSSNMGWGAGYNGFRAGTSFPYQPLEDQYPLWEIPFQLMDRNPISTPQEYMRLFDRYLKAIKGVGGCLVLNIHQENFHEEVAPNVGKVYRNILEVLANDPDIIVLKIEEVCKIIQDVKKNS